MARLLFFPDYGADPVWDLADETMVPVDRLPIEQRLRDAIRAWAAEWDAWAWPAMDDPDQTAPPGLWERGEDLCHQLRTALPNSQVGWTTFPPEGRTVQWERDGPTELVLPQED